MDSNEQTDVEIRRQDERVRLLYVDIQSLHARIDKLVREKRKAEFDLEQVYASFSWRVSGILRAIRYVAWTLPILSFQWAQRIFLDKGLIKKVKQHSRDAVEATQSSRLNKKKALNKTIEKINPLSEQYPEYEESLVFVEYETQYIGKQSQSNRAWSKQALENYKTASSIGGNVLRDSLPKDYDLRNPGVFRRQAHAAIDSGLDGFCYRYRDCATNEDFDGPIMNHYRNAELNLFYCICWSSDSVETEKFELLESYYLRKFIKYCSKLFDDKRYLYKKSRPLIVVKGLNEAQLRMATDVWQKWSTEEESVMPFILPLDGRDVKDLSGANDLASVRETLGRNVDCFKFVLNSSNLDFASTLISNLRSFSKPGRLVFLDSWNDWNNKHALESNRPNILELKQRMRRAREAFGRNSKQVVAVIVDQSIETENLRNCIGHLRDLGYRSKLIVLDETDFNFNGVSSLKLRGRDNAWDGTLLRMEKQGCHTAISLVKMSENMTECLLACGWKTSHVKSKSIGIEALREDLRLAGLWLPRITVICDVSSKTRVSSIVRFITQIEKQSVVPVEIVFKGQYLDEKITSEKVPHIHYVEYFELSKPVLGEIVWLSHIETMLPEDFLVTQSRMLQRSDTVAVLYPFKNAGEQSGINGRNFSRLKAVRTKDIVSVNKLRTKNILGSFQEVLCWVVIRF